MQMDGSAHNKKRIRILLCNFDERFNEYVQGLYLGFVDLSPNEKNYDVIAIGEKGCPFMSVKVNGDVVFCPHEKPLPNQISCESLIDCGMNEKCSLTFSSVGDENAMLCINRDILYKGKRIEQSEKNFTLIPKLTLYDNIVLGGIASIYKNYLQ